MRGQSQEQIELLPRISDMAGNIRSMVEKCKTRNGRTPVYGRLTYYCSHSVRHFCYSLSLCRFEHGALGGMYLGCPYPYTTGRLLHRPRFRARKRKVGADILQSGDPALPICPLISRHPLHLVLARSGPFCSVNTTLQRHVEHENSI